MRAEIFAIKYIDKATAAVVYKKLSQYAEELFIIAYGIEKCHSRSRRIRNFLKINLVIDNEKAKNLPSILKILHDSLKDHPLYPYLSFDYTAVPTSKTEWNFDSYDDPTYQKIFIQKRTKG